IGCSGGIDTNIEYAYKTIKAEANLAFYQFSVTGLKGGHSGMDIHLGRGNANKILARLLYQCEEKYQVKLAHFNGGSLSNAIPREAFTTVAIPTNNVNDFLALVEQTSHEIKNELQYAEPKLIINWVSAEPKSELFAPNETCGLINAIYASPNGALRMSDTIIG